MKTPALVIAASALALVAGSCIAQGYGYGPGMGYGPRTTLNLSDEQFKLRDMYAARADAGAIAERQKKVDGLREQMFAQRDAMRREMDAVLGR